MKCSTTGHSNDNCRQDVRFVQTKCFYDICQEHGEHTQKDFPFNMKDGKESRCAICETKNHNTADCHLYLKNRQNYHAVYQTNAVAQSNEQNHVPTIRTIKDMKVEDTSIGMTTDVEAMEVEVDSLEIETTNHVDPSNSLHVIRRDIGMQTVHIRTKLTSNFVLIVE